MQRLVSITGSPSSTVTFDAFVANEGERLRRALVARYGVDTGNDVCADALAYAWQHWRRVEPMENPIGYLYRVAQSASRRHRRWRQRPNLPPERSRVDASTDIDLGAALARLKPVQRTCVVLVHIYDWSYDDVAATLGVTGASVRNHLHRGITRLRGLLEDPNAH